MSTRGNGGLGSSVSPGGSVCCNTDRIVRPNIARSNIGAGQPCLVCVVDDDRSIAKKGRICIIDRGVEVDVLGQERIRGYLAVFPTQISNLASLGLVSIASRRLATIIRV